MIDTIIRTLKILIDDPLKHNASVFKYKGDSFFNYEEFVLYSVTYFHNNIKYIMTISDDRIRISTERFGENILVPTEIKYPDDIAKAEIMLLVNKLIMFCEQVSKDALNNFVIHNNIESNGIDD